MLLISEVSQKTKISVDTLRWWARKNLLPGAEQRPIPGGYAWYATVAAALFRKANPPRRGKPPKTDG